MAKAGPGVGPRVQPFAQSMAFSSVLPCLAASSLTRLCADLWKAAPATTVSRASREARARRSSAFHPPAAVPRSAYCSGRQQDCGKWIPSGLRPPRAWAVRLPYIRNHFAGRGRAVLLAHGVPCSSPPPLTHPVPFQSLRVAGVSEVPGSRIRDPGRFESQCVRLRVDRVLPADEPAVCAGNCTGCVFDSAAPVLSCVGLLRPPA